MALHIKVLLLALAAMTAMLLITSPAMALRSIGIEGERTVRAEGNLKFAPANEREQLTVEQEITCEVTLLRTINASIAKRAGAVMGKITGVRIDVPRCRSGTLIRVSGVIALKEMTGLVSECSPAELLTVRLCVTTGGTAGLWELTYNTFLGTLPNITGILFTIQRVQVKLLIVDSVFRITSVCAYEGNVAALSELREGRLTGASILLRETSLVARRLSGVTCPSPIRISGNFGIANGPRLKLL
jgi:hypothetical protein